MSFSLLISTLINGLSLGSIYALIALGYTMVYGIAKMLNFAHGDIIMVGAYIVYSVAKLTNANIFIAIPACVVVCCLLGILIERLAYKPLRGASSLAVLITAIGVSYLLQNVFLLIFGSANTTFPTLVDFSVLNITLGSVVIKGKVVCTLVVSIIIMVALTLFISKSKTGKAMRAVSEDRDCAELMGISVNKTITITFAIGSVLASVASIFYGFTYGTIVPTLGSMPGIKAFTAAVLGGIGSVPGAMIGGVILGVIEQIASMLSTQFELGNWSDAIVFGILILVLIVKPTGLLGKNVREKV